MLRSKPRHRPTTSRAKHNRLPRNHPQHAPHRPSTHRTNNAPNASKHRGFQTATALRRQTTNHQQPPAAAKMNHGSHPKNLDNLARIQHPRRPRSLDLLQERAPRNCSLPPRTPARPRIRLASCRTQTMDSHRTPMASSNPATADGLETSRQQSKTPHHRLRPIPLAPLPPRLPNASNNRSRRRTHPNPALKKP